MGYGKKVNINTIFIIVYAFCRNLSGQIKGGGIAMISKEKNKWFMGVIFIHVVFFGVISTSFAGAISYTYDDAGRLTRVSSGDGRLIKYTYDNAGNLLQKETVVCEAEAIETSSTKLTLKRKKKKKQDVTVTMTGAEGCPSEGITVEAAVNAAGKKRVSVSPTSKETDDKGQAVFTINAKNKSGNAKITFKAGSLSQSISVKVGK